MTSTKKRKTKNKSSLLRQRWSKRILAKQKLKENKAGFTENYTKLKNRSRLFKIEEEEKISKNDSANEPKILCIVNEASKVQTQSTIFRKLSSFMFYPLNKFLSGVSKSWSIATQRKRKYEELEKRVCLLENEIEIIKKQKCNTQTCIGSSASSTPLSPHSTVKLTNVAHVSLVPPAPPPPPPPPLPPMLMPMKLKVPRAVKKIENTPNSTKKKTNTQQLITADLLKTITLRKVSTSLETLEESDKENTIKDRKLVTISLSDLRNVKLRKAAHKESSPRRRTPVGSISLASILRPRNGTITKSKEKRTPEHSFRQRLRRSNVLRSPGGTPLVRNKDFTISLGEGLTPMLSNALKKKFVGARPSDPSTPEEIHSPTTVLQFEQSP